MRRILFLIIFSFMGKAYCSYTFFLQPSISFLYNYSPKSLIVKNVSVTIDKFYVDFLESPNVYLPSEIQKEKSFYTYETLQGSCIKAERSWEAMTVFCGEERVGRIQIEPQTSNGAKFTIYDHQERPIALAYLDKALWHLIIVDSQDSSSRIAYLHKYHQSYFRGMNQVCYYGWKVEVWQDKIIDPALLIMFASFIGDTYWDEFKRPIGKPYWTFD